MTLEEFYDKLKFDFNTYIVKIKQRYSHEKEYDYVTATCWVSADGFEWDWDWNEGQEDVVIVSYITMEDIDDIMNAVYGLSRDIGTTVASIMRYSDADDKACEWLER